MGIMVGLLYLMTSLGYASGGITHMLIAQETIARIPNAELRNLLKSNLDAYLVGAYYPDSGYAGGNHYGEDSHWDPFIYTFADYIKEKYPEPSLQNPKLVAFLFGCAVHRVSDEVAHWTFYPFISKQDFGKEWDWDKTIHQYGDLGLDLLITVDKNQWFTQPTTWWVPVRDLVEVYHRMGHDEYTAKEITWGNQLIYYAGFGERLIAAPAYPVLRWKLPWTSTHYYDWSEGGIVANEQQVATYLMVLWERLNNKQQGTKTARHAASKRMVATEHHEIASIDFAEQVVGNGYVDVAVVNNSDGSIDLQPPVIKSIMQFQAMLSDFLKKIIG